MTISCIVATFGRQIWANKAAARAIPSTKGQGFHEVLTSHLPDGTLAEARNSGAVQATSEWLLFLDADDELALGFGDAMREASWLEPSRPALFTPAVKYVSGQKNEVAPKIWPRIDFKSGNWCVIGTLIERALFQKLGGFREYGMYEDWALWAMAAEAGAEVYEVPSAVYIAHHETRSRNRTPPRHEKVLWHQVIGHDIWPDHYDEVTQEEMKEMRLRTSGLRVLA